MEARAIVPTRPTVHAVEVQDAATIELHGMVRRDPSYGTLVGPVRLLGTQVSGVVAGIDLEAVGLVAHVFAADVT